MMCTGTRGGQWSVWWTRGGRGPPAPIVACAGAVGVRTCGARARGACVGGGGAGCCGCVGVARGYERVCGTGAGRPGPWTARWPAVGAAKLRPRALPGFPPPRPAPSLSPWPRALPAPAPQPPGRRRHRHRRRLEPPRETGMTATPDERRGRPAAAPSSARSVRPASVSLAGAPGRWRRRRRGSRPRGAGGGRRGDKSPGSGRRGVGAGTR